MAFSDDYKKDRRDRSLKQVEAGGIPLDAEWRLKRLNENRRFFTSNLTVNELALSVSVGIHPLGQVMGASTYHVGWQSTKGWNTPMVSGQLKVPTQALYQARNLAIGRLQQEAKLLGADGVIGVRVDRHRREDKKDILEYMAIGTAVRLDGPDRWSNPFISAMSVQELWSLLRAGHFPVGMVFGASVYYHVAAFANQMAMQRNRGFMSRNVELSDYSGAISIARQFAMGQIEFEATSIGADGVVGVTVDNHIRDVDVDLEVAEQKIKRRDLIVTFTAQGTAIMPVSDKPFAIDYTMFLD